MTVLLASLAPLFGFLFGGPLSAAMVAGGAVSIPIIIHLLNRKRFRVVTWAAMRFLLAAQRKNSRRMRLEQLILLAVRCLVVLLLVLAMVSVTPWAEAMWHWMNPEGGKGTTSGGRRTHKILVIDGSFSMGTRRGDSTCFDRARSIASQMVREGGGGDGYSVVLMAAPPRRIVPEPSEDARKVAGEIDKVRLTSGNSDLVGTLNTVESLLRSSPGRFPEKEVYFLTDLQRATWISPQPGTVAPILKKIQDRARTIFVDVGEDGVGNLALTGLALDDPLATTGRKTLIKATLQNYGDTREKVSVRLYVGRASAGKGDPKWELAEKDEKQVHPEHGQQTPVTFEYAFPAPGEYVVQVQVASDRLELDDVRSMVVRVQNTVPVLLVNGKPAGQYYDQATGWLRTALNPVLDGPTPSEIIPRPEIRSLTEFGDEGLGALAGFDCVFLCDVPALTLAQVNRLERHVRGGGAVVFCLGPNVDLHAYNEALYRDGRGLLPARLISRRPAPKGYSYQLAMAPEADREPPLTIFRDSAAREELLKGRFHNFIQVAPAPRAGPRTILSFLPVVIPGREKDAATVREAPVGGPAVLEWNPPAPNGTGRLRGRVLLITTTVNADWGTWTGPKSYPPLMNELLYYAVAPRLRERSLSAGQPIELFRERSDAADAEVTTPDDRKETIHSQDAEGGGSVLRWTDTDLRGVYTLTVGGAPREYLYAVNVPATNESQQSTESDLARTTRDEIQKVYPEWTVQVVTDPGQVDRSDGPAGSTTETFLRPLGPGIAHWLLLALLVLVLAEVVLAWQFGHYSAALGAADQATPRQPSRWRWVLYSLPWVLFALTLGIGFILIHDAYTGDFLGFLPDRARQVVEGWVGVPPPAPGEGSRWRLELSSYLWDSHSDPWLAAALAIGTAALVFLIYRREGSGTTNRGMRLLMVGLRLGFVLLLLAVFLPQDKLWFERQGYPDVVLMIDDSQSMSTVDRYRDPRVKEAAEKLAQLGGLSDVERLGLAQALLTRGDTDWLTTLLTQRKVRLHVYHCSGRAHRLADVEKLEEVAPALEAIRGLRAEPKNDSSQLGTAVRQVLNDFRGSSLAAVVLLTDGVTTEGEDLAKVSKYADQMGVPLFFVGIGDAREVRDLYLHDLHVDENPYVNDTVVFEVSVTGQGYDNLTVPVTLHEKGSDKVLDRKMAQIDPNHKTVKVHLKVQPREPGEKIYELRVPVQADEVEKDNNRIQRQIFVHESKKIKVLYVEGYRRYEYEYLKTLLERESNRLKGNKSIELKVLLLDADQEYASEDRSAVSEFPPKAELATYDVVILGDVDPEPRHENKMTEHLKHLADFVRERGGGLLVMSGERFAPSAYKDSPLKDVLPIDVTAPRPDDNRVSNPITEEYRPELTPVGRMHPIFRLNTSDDKEREEIWSQLRGMFWYADGYQPKRAAEVLAVHPKVGAAGKPAGAGGVNRHPLVLQQFAGSGRCLFFGFHETWRWGFREKQKYFNEFWIQTIRYLARSRVGRIELKLDRQTPYRRGEPIKITVRFPDDTPPPPADTKVQVVAERRVPGRIGDAEVRTITLNKVQGARAAYDWNLTQTPEGEYKFWLSQPASRPTPHAEAKVLAPPGEMERLQMNQSEMERAAQESHGRFYTLADAGKLLDELPAGTRVTVNAPGPPYLVWNSFVLFLIAALFLTTEWLLRKQKNLL